VFSVSQKGVSHHKIIAWFAKEIQALPDAIGKANKNFLVYCLIRVLKMLQEHARCSHVVGLETIMAACDASIFYGVPADVMRIAAHVVKKRWSSYGLPYVTDLFRIELEVRLNCAKFF
jgi:hypothetical protein